MKKIDFLIVGAGMFGCVIAERIANILKKNVLIIDKRDHIGGNCYSQIDGYTGIEYHKYGTHIFHTSNSKVIDYILNFTKFNNYNHQVLTNHNNKVYQMPINLETINSYFNKSLNPEGAKKFLKKITLKDKFLRPLNFEEKAISQIGKDLYNAFIKNYTIKQWNKNPIDLPASIFNRLPIRFNYNENYFHNYNLQGIPLDGYTNLFKNLIDNKRIKIELKKDYFENLNKIDVKYFTIYTGPIDKLFNYEFGKLEWRSLKFQKIVKNINDYQGTSVMNFADISPRYTRIHEPKHLHPERTNIFESNKTLIIKEYSILNEDEPYYPINSKKNIILSKKYKALAKNFKNILLGGRLADYAYYDMDMTISAALKKFEYIQTIVE